MGGVGETIHIDEYLWTEVDAKVLEMQLKGGGVSVSDTENPVTNYGSRTDGPWVLALCWRRQHKLIETRFFILEDRKAETLLPIIEGEVVVGSTVYTDKWGGYRDLRERGFVHEAQRNSKVFIDPETGKKAHSIDRLLENMQRKFNVKSSEVNFFSLFLREEWWRSCNPADTFDAFLRDMKRVYCPDELEESVVSLLGES
jgi:transposase-like protein